MLFNRDLLFVHVPKTGGMSMRLYLQYLMRQPCYAMGHWHGNYGLFKPVPRDLAGGEDSFGKDRDDVVYLNGEKHAPIYYGLLAMTSVGLSTSELQAIVVGIRNPYAQEVSVFAFNRKQGAIPPERTFSEYVLGPRPFHFASIYDYRLYYESPMHGLQDRIRIIRFENMKEEIEALSLNLGLGVSILPWENRTEHKPWQEYIASPEIEAAIYQRYRWVFDHGFYPRLSF